MENQEDLDLEESDVETDEETAKRSAEQKAKNEERASMWLTKIRNARQFELTYRRDALSAIRRFRGEKHMYDLGYRTAGYTRRRLHEFSTRLNVFYANVETLNSIICPVIPQIVVQKKPNKKDVLTINERKFFTVCCEVLEKLLQYYIDRIPMREYQKFKYDWLITGRGVFWVSFSDVEGQEVIGKDVKIERVCWNDFAMDPKTKWSDVKWVARRTFLNKGEFMSNFPEVDLEKVSFSSYKTLIDYEGEDIDFNLYATGDKFTEVWELWDKDTQHAMYLSQYYEDKMLKRIHVKELRENFLPTPEPILSIENNMNLKPRSEMWSYVHELEALSRASHRQEQLVDSMQAKAFVSSTFTDMVQKINETSEGYITTVNGLPSNVQNPIHYIDNQQKQQTIAGLNEYQMKLMDNIYKITGLSEVMRNVSTEETATTARYRSKFGSMRLQARQRLLADYMKNVYKIAANVACRNLDKETMAEITSITMRPQEQINQEIQNLMMQQQQMTQQIQQLQQQIQQDQQDMQMAAQQQQQGQQMPPEEQGQGEMPPGEEGMPPEEQGMQEPQAPPPPDPQQLQQQMQQAQQQMQDVQFKEMQLDIKIQNLKAEVSWEKVLDFLDKKKLTEFLVDVETDFESLEDDPQIVQERMQFLDVFINTIQRAIPIMQSDPSIADLMANLISFTLDGFRMGRSQRGMIDEYLFNITQNIKVEAQKPKQPQPNPEQIKAQAAMMEAQAKMQEVQVKMQKVQVEAQQGMQEGQQSNMHEMQKLQTQLQAQAQRAQEKMQTDTNLMQMKIQADDNRYQKKQEADMLKAQMQERNKLKQAREKNLQGFPPEQNKF